MTLYKKQIRPMISPPALQGLNTNPRPLYDNDMWFNEDDVNKATVNKWVLDTEKQDPMYRMVIQERFIKVNGKM